MYRTPRDLETKFRQSLGAIGPLMCVADIATHELIKNNDIASVSKLTKTYNHKRLNVTHVNLEGVSLYVNLAHIAYINSRADLFCSEVNKFSKKTNNAKNSKDNDSYNIDSIDFLRKAVFLVHARKNELKKSTTKLDDSVYIDYLGQEELWVIDYYRTLRNVEFHGGINKDECINSLDESIKIEIQKKFNFYPNSFNNLNIRDVILFSQAWQSVAKKFCSKLITIDNALLEKIKAKYTNDDETRRNNALRQKLKQDYLQPEYIINILESNDWVA
jgi:hypothetical protein